MTQLILDLSGENLTLPESQRGGYSCENTPLKRDLEMASGRLVRELYGHVYTVKYQYGFLTEAQRDSFISACEKGWRQAISCSVLYGTQIITSDFLVTAFTFPKFMWSRTENGETVPMYGDFHVELREVMPHD